MTIDLDCRQASRLLSSRMDTPLRPAERAGLHRHLVECETCRHVDAQMRFLRRAMRRLGPGGPKA